MRVKVVFEMAPEELGKNDDGIAYQSDRWDKCIPSITNLIESELEREFPETKVTGVDYDWD